MLPYSITVVSNGHGEDYIAAQLLKAAHHLYPTATLTAIPLVGKGTTFTALDFPVHRPLTNPTFPSGGFIRNLSTLFKDLKAGLLGNLLKQRKFLKAHANTQDWVIAVGDIFCLWMCHGLPEKTLFLPTAKSDLFMKHSDIEIQLMKKRCAQIFPRDQITTDSLKNYHLPAQFLGNPMFDNLTAAPSEIILPQNQPVLGILPGSREEAYLNFEKILTLLSSALTLPKLTLLISVPSTLDKTRLEHQATVLNPKAFTPIFTTQFNHVLANASAIIGLAGTANEQAAFAKIPVITFPGTGPQTTPQRLQEQQQLLGDIVTYIHEPTPQTLAIALTRSLSTTKSTHTSRENASEKIMNWALSQK